MQAKIEVFIRTVFETDIMPKLAASSSAMASYVVDFLLIGDVDAPYENLKLWVVELNPFAGIATSHSPLLLPSLRVSPPLPHLLCV